MATVTSTTDADFDADVVKSDKITLVDFWAPWCGPCRAVAPVLEEIATEHADKLRVVKQNTDENPQITGKLGITSIPTLHVYMGSEIVKTIIGVRPKPVLLRELQPFTVYGSSRVLATLKANSVFNVLDASVVPRRELPLGAATAIEGAGQDTGLVIEAFAVPGKIALYLESGAADANYGSREGDAIGLKVTAPATGKHLLYWGSGFQPG